MNAQVSRWLDDAQDIKRKSRLDQGSYHDAVILALIEIESAGDENARRPKSQFCGLLQMGSLAGEDAGFKQRGRDTTASLIGDGRAAISSFLIYQERYAARHMYHPNRIALLWKAGPGTLSKINALSRDGWEFAGAVKNGAAGIPNTEEYLRRFRGARERWAAWLGKGCC